MSLSAGTRIGPYEVVSMLGAGGMGEVYKAKDTRLERTVAIKILSAQNADQEHRARFEREARTIAGLSHPHICTLHDVGEFASSLFLVMEHLDGETLAERLRSGRLPLDQALEIAIQIAEALAAAHRAGIVHRDLKPGNIMLTTSGVKLLDFGLAKLGANAGQPLVVSAPTHSAPLTGPGTILGTLQYMAPEQLEGKETDARTDIFALGTVLYEMVSGRRAFDGHTSASVVAAILERDPPSLLSLRPSAPTPLDHVLRLCMAKQPDERWQSARDVERELTWIRHQADAQQDITRRWSGWRVSGVIALASVAALAGAAAARLTQRAGVPPATVTRFVVQLPAGNTLDVGLRQALAFGPDGSQFVYAARRDGISHLFLRRLDHLDPVLLPGTEGASGPFFSSDGQSVGFFAAGKLMKTDLGGGVPVILAETPSGRGAAWAENGTIVFSAAPGTGLWRVPATGGAATVMTNLDATQQERTHRWPEVLPGGITALLTVRGAQHVSFDEASIVSLALESGERGSVLGHGSQPRYAKTGHLIFARGGALHAVRFDPEKLAVDGSATVVLEHVMTDPTTGTAHYALSDQGALAYISGGEWTAERTLLWRDRRGMERAVLGRSLAYSTPRISPDDHRIAVTVEAATDDVWVAEIGSQTPARLTFETGSHVAPVWTPDGQRVAFASNAFGPYNLFWKKADGGEFAERLTESPHIQFPGSWSPDGRLLAFTESDPATSSDIWVLPLDAPRRPRPVVQTRFNEHGPAFSPDGRWLAYCSNESGREEIYVQPFPGPGEKRQLSVDGGREPVWSRRGDLLFFRNANRILVARMSMPTFAAGGSPALVAEGDFVPSPMSGVPSYDVSSDGQQLLLARESRLAAPSTIHVVLDWFQELKAKVPVTK